MPPKKKTKHLASNVCIIHFDDRSFQDQGKFIFLSNTKNPDERFTKLQDICTLRLSQPPDSVYRLERVCKSFPSEIQSNHGYHKTFYERFTLNLDRITDEKDCSGSKANVEARKSSRESLTANKIIFGPECIFCNASGYKKIKIKGEW